MTKPGDGGVWAPGTTSAELRHLYEERYYVEHMAGHHLVGDDDADLAAFTNIRRAYALMLEAEPKNVTDLGAGRGELARHLLARGVRVTLIDYSDAAIELARRLVGEHERASFIVADAAELGEHVPPGSQDAIFMTDVVEHISSPELRRIFDACREVMTERGTLCVHTPEKYYGSVITQSALGRYHINLFEIEDLLSLLAETFPAVEAFTWNGIERFAERGKSIELFGIGRNQPFEARQLPLDSPRVFAEDTLVWTSSPIASQLDLPPRFLLRCSCHVATPPEDSVAHVIYQTADPGSYFWTGFPLASLLANPASLQLSSELTAAVGEPAWSDIERIILRVRSPTGARVDVRISDLTILTA